MSKRQPHGNIKMRGKRVVQNPCPCCDPIENKKKRNPRGPVQEKIIEEWDSKKYGTGPLLGDY